MTIRDKIRAEIKSELEGEIEIDGQEIPVFSNRYLPLKNTPAIIIYTLGDNADKTPDEQAYIRTERASIVCAISGKESQTPMESGEATLSEKLDNIAQQIEEILNTQRNDLNGVIYRLNYRSTDITIRPDSSPLEGIMTMSYDAVYHDQL